MSDTSTPAPTPATAGTPADVMGLGGEPIRGSRFLPPKDRKRVDRLVKTALSGKRPLSMAEMREVRRLRVAAEVAWLTWAGLMEQPEFAVLRVLLGVKDLPTSRRGVVPVEDVVGDGESDGPAGVGLQEVYHADGGHGVGDDVGVVGADVDAGADRRVSH